MVQEISANTDLKSKLEITSKVGECVLNANIGSLETLHISIQYTGWRQTNMLLRCDGVVDAESTCKGFRQSSALSV